MRLRVLKKNATGYAGKVTRPSNPMNITVKSSLGGSATANVKEKYCPPLAKLKVGSRSQRGTLDVCS
jgi:hypothetical protein